MRNEKIIKNKAKNQSVHYKILYGRAPGPFLLAVVLTIIFMGSVGYLGTGFVLNGSEASDSDLTSEEATVVEEEMASEPLELTEVSFDSFHLYTVQVSSLTSLSAAENAVALFANEGIPTVYYSTGEQYKIIAGASADEDITKRLVKRIAEKYPKYNDAFSSDVTLNIDSADLAVGDAKVDAIKEDVATLMIEISDDISEALINDDFTEAEFKRITSKASFLEDITTEEADQNIVAHLKAFIEDLNQLYNRKANVGEYNKLWLAFMFS